MNDITVTKFRHSCVCQTAIRLLIAEDKVTQKFPLMQELRRKKCGSHFVKMCKGMETNVLDVKKIRSEWKMSQSEFAKEVGVSKRTVQSWEYGAKVPTSKVMLIRAIEARKGEETAPMESTPTETLEPSEMARLIADLRDMLVESQRQVSRLVTIVEQLTK